MKAFLLATIITGYLFTDKDPQRTLDQQYKAYVMAQQITPKEVTKLKKRILSGKKLPFAAQQFITQNIAWDLIAEGTLSSYWGELNEKQQKAFTRSLKKMLLKKFSKFFDPGKKFSVKFPEPTEYKIVRGRKFSKVKTIIYSTVKDFEFEVDFIFIFSEDHWMLCDIYIDGVSSTRNYRSSLRRIFKKEGYKGMMKRVKNNT
jgi:ABC-type transporter MlaC component